MQKRLDQWLVELKMAPTKTKAKDLVLAGAVFLGETPLKKPGALYSKEDLSELRVFDDQILKYVSRGGLKLEGALNHLQLSVKGLKVLDVGSSTGGFSDCLLKSGANFVVGFDVGHNQLHHSLFNHPQLKNFEGVHFLQTQIHPELSFFLQQKMDLIVADVSFVSLDKLFPLLKNWLLPKGKILLLVKPQFELSAQDLSKKGVVKKDALYKKVEEKLCLCARENGFHVIDYFASVILGKDGNKEFFIYCN